MTTAPTQASATEFVEFFAAGWELGARDAEGFFRHFGPRMHPDTALIQPIAPDARGRGALRELFGPLFKAIPDLTGTLRRWGQTDDGVFIELTLRGHWAAGRLSGRSSTESFWRTARFANDGRTSIPHRY